LLAQYPLPLAKNVDPYDVLGVARTEHLDDFVARGERPPYISRTTADRELDEALKKANRFVILTGRAKSGKSRTAFEAVRRNFPDYAMLIPARPGDASRLPELLQSYDELADSNPNTVLWLDDMERFVDAGSLSVSLISRAQQKHQALVIVATLRSIEFDKLTDAAGEIGRNAKDVLNRAVRVQLGDVLATGEQEKARQLYSARYPNLDFKISVGESFVAAQQLKARYDTGAESCPEGAAVVRAAIDCRRIGVMRPIPEIFLKELWKYYIHELEPLRDASDADYTGGLSWAKEPLGRYVALLAKVGDPEHSGGFSVPDYLVEHVEEQQRPIPLVVWDLAKDRYQDLGSDVTGVGYIAWLRGLTGKAKEIWEKGLLLGDGRSASNLGAQLVQEGDRIGAKAAFKRGIALGAGGAAHNLGVLLADDGDRSGAKAAFEGGMALGEGSAAFNLGFLLVEDGDRNGAKAAYEQGIALGDGGAALNLGLLLKEDGDRSGAKAAYQAAVELGFEGAQEKLQHLNDLM
jgi:cellulose synthase operon protein C